MKGEREKIGQKNPDVEEIRQKLPLLRKREFGSYFGKMHKSHPDWGDPCACLKCDSVGLAYQNLYTLRLLCANKSVLWNMNTYAGFCPNFLV